MRELRRVQGLILLVAGLLCCRGAAAAAECRIDHRFATRQGETLLALAPIGHRAAVRSDGSVRFADGSGLSVACTGPFAFSRRERPTQQLLEGRLPIVMTRRESAKLAMELTAFAAASPPVDCLRVVVRNRTAAAIQPVLRVEADTADGTFKGKHTGFQRGGQILALCELRQGTGQIVGAVKPKRNVFRRTGGRPLPQWGHPKVPCDRGFRNIVAGFAEPATYHLQAKPKTRYIVAVGFCESHWKTPGNRICDLLIEGKCVATVDPVKKPHRPDVPFVLTFPASDRDGNGWISVASVANRSSPDVNSIINVIWLFEESVGKELAPADIAAGKANRLTHCYIDCGGRAEAPGPATLDYRLDLPPNGSATLWLKRPAAAIRVAGARKLAAVDPAALLADATAAWRKRTAQAQRIQLSDPAPTNLLAMSLTNLAALCARDGDGVALRSGPFAAPFSPGAAAFGAVALDRMGDHAAAASILATLAKRRADDRLWHDGADKWNATGQALWALLTHYQLTGDRTWLAANYPTILSAAEALIEACDHTKWSTHDPVLHFHGLIPAAPFHTLPADYWLVHDCWAWNGIRCAAQAARALEKPNDYKWLEDDLQEYTACLRRSIARSRVSGPAAGCLPALPGEAEAWTFAACVAALYPARVPAAGDKLVAATFRYLDAHSVEALPGGLDGRSPSIDVPLAAHFALARVARGDGDAALAAFTTLANLATPTATFPQRADPRTRRASGLAPSAAAAAGYILLLRDMLVREQGDELHLFSCVPQSWLAKGLAVNGAPTTFGPLSCRVVLAPGGKLVVEAVMPARHPPRAVVVHLPRPAAGVKAARATTGQAEAMGDAVRVTGWHGRGKLEIDLATPKTR